MSGSIAIPKREYGLYIFDLDGTIYLGDTLLPGVARLLEHLRAASRSIVFLSNNPTKDREQYVRKLQRLGVRAAPHEVINTIVSMVAWLQARTRGQGRLPDRGGPTHPALGQAGIRVSEDPAEVDIVIASYDRSFEYPKLQIAFDAIWQRRRAFLVVTNPDRYCPIKGGAGEPDTAAIIAAIEACTGTRCVANVGKPDSIMIDTITRTFNVDPTDCLIVGDRIETDVRMAKNAGLASALVLTGDSGLADVAATESRFRPDYVLGRIDQLVPGLADGPQHADSFQPGWIASADGSGRTSDQ